ncbi:MAG TPA: DUF3857 domain-containing protein, partial [Terracidiphilus sp.]|nr:DUF3857 domain-containing protein [Terracidiphilus sp.]
MRIHLVAGAVLVASLLLPWSGFAQKFQEPTQQELQMKSDPMAPGAPAVYLYREESTDNNSHFISEYARIKILTDAGKRWATVYVPYSGSGAPPRIEARTIHADGTVVPLTGKPEDLLAKSTHSGYFGGREFTLPAVEVGSILEYRWTLPISDTYVSGVIPDNQPFINSALAGSIPYWAVQSDLFIHKEHFYYNPLSYLAKNVVGNQSITHYTSDGEIAHYLLFSARLPAGAQVKVSPKPDYTLDIENVPAFVHEAYAPPEQSRLYAVRFYFTPYLSGDVFWTDEGKRWSKSVGQASEPTDDLKAAAAQITAGAATAEDKARKLYDAVQSLDNTAFTRQQSQSPGMRTGSGKAARSADAVWKAKSGTPNEMAMLYLALVRAAGLQASAMRVTDRSRSIFDPGYLSLDQLTVDLVVLHIDGKDVFLDPGEKLLPFGQLYWSHTLSGGLLQTADGVTHEAITPPGTAKDAIDAHTADLTLDAQGGVTGTVKALLTGPEALRWRQLNLTEGEAEVRQQFSVTLPRMLPPGIPGELEQVSGLTASAGFLTFTVKVSGHLGQ